MTEEEKRFKQYKREAVKAAIDFNYGHAVLLRLENASYWEEIHRIMVTARKEKFGDD